MLNRSELQRAARILNHRLAGTILDRATQPDGSSVVLTFRSAKSRTQLLISCAVRFGRISIVITPLETPSGAGGFAEYVNAHVRGARLQQAHSAEHDRIVRLILAGKDDSFEILVSFLGPRSNVFLLDAERKILFALRSFDETRRDLAPGATWVDPAGSSAAGGAADRWAGEADETYLESIEASYGQLQENERFEQAVRRVAQALKKGRQSLEKKARTIASDLKGAGQAEETRRLGELLKGVLHTIQPRQTEAEVVDFENGTRITIPLDPSLTPAENLAHCFRQYQKLVRRKSELERQHELVQAGLKEIADLEARLLAVSSIEDSRALETIAQQPSIRRLLGPVKSPSDNSARKQARAAAQTRDQKRIPSRLKPKRYRSSDGLEIWVGRSDEGNDYLTTRLARGRDLFFHLEGAPGSHIVLRTEGEEDAPSESLLEACELAVHFSRAKSATRADVHVSAIKNVRKPAGAKPGLVYVQRGKTIHLRRSRTRLERVLASRLDE